MKQTLHPSNQMTVLIVDDDGLFARVLGRALSRRGLAVWPAQTAAEARCATDAIQPDFAVVDLHLAGDSGFDVLEHLSAHSANTRTVVLSGYATPALAVRAMKLGAVDCLTKPVDIEVLAQALTGTPEPSASRTDTVMEPSEARLHHVLAHWEKNDRNTMQTAKVLGMHRRTLQRILKRAGFGRSDMDLAGKPTQFSKLRRLYQVWSRALRIDAGSA